MNLCQVPNIHSVSGGGGRYIAQFLVYVLNQAEEEGGKTIIFVLFLKKVSKEDKKQRGE